MFEKERLYFSAEASFAAEQLFFEEVFPFLPIFEEMPTRFRHLLMPVACSRYPSLLLPLRGDVTVCAAARRRSESLFVFAFFAAAMRKVKRRCGSA